MLFLECNGIDTTEIDPMELYQPMIARALRLKGLLIGHPLIVVYCREDALFSDSGRMAQFLKGITHLPIPLDPDALVVSDNADLYGTCDDIEERLAGLGG